MLGTAFSFLSVGAGYGGTLIGTAVFEDTLAWLVGGLLASMLFVLVESLELAVVEPFKERWVQEDGEDEEEEKS